MSEALIPIINVEGKRVVEFRWTGGMIKGSGKLVAMNGREGDLKKVKVAIEAYRELEEVEFYSNSKEKLMVAGWEGFEGNMAGLRLALPSVGLRIDNDNVKHLQESEYGTGLSAEAPRVIK